MICFIFGTFNPVTRAHMHMGVEAQRALGDNCRVVYVPDTLDYIKNVKGLAPGDIMPDEDRIRLLTELCDSFGFEVALTEVLGISDGKAYNTISHFEDDDKWLCIGADLVDTLPMWYKSSELLSECGLLVLRRAGSGNGYMATELGRSTREYRCIDVPGDLCGISSSLVRDAYRREDFATINKMTYGEVYRYLRGNKHVYF